VRTVEAAGVSLALREWGEPGSPPLLFWHGAGDGSAQFEQAGRVLADEDGLHVLAPDAPGHGHSGPLADDEYLPSRLAAVAASLLAELGMGATVWAGYSWGASVGCRFAAEHPQQTRALVLLEGGFLDFGDLDRGAPEPRLEQLVREHGLAGALQWGLRREPVRETYAALRAAQLPVLLVVDRHDHGSETLGFDPVERFRAEVPQAQVERVETSHGHDLLGHDARNVARLVGDWLAAHDLL